MAVSLRNLQLGCYRQAVLPAGAKQRLGGRRSLPEVAGVIAGRGGVMEPLVRELRGLLGPDGEKTPESTAFKERRLGAFTSSGVIPGLLAGGWPAHHSGLYQFDVEADGLAAMGVGAAEFRDVVKSLDYAALVFVSPSFGVKALLRGKPGPSAPERQRMGDESAKRAQEREWAALMQQACSDIPGLSWVHLDQTVKNVGRLCFLSWDPGCYLNVAAEPADGIYSDSGGVRGAGGSRRLSGRILLSHVNLDGVLREIGSELGLGGESNADRNLLGVIGGLKNLGWSESQVREWARENGIKARFGWAGLEGSIDGHVSIMAVYNRIVRGKN